MLVYIKYYNVYKKSLQYNLIDKIYTEVDRFSVPENAIWVKGFYVMVSNIPLAVFSTDSGAILLYDRIFYPLYKHEFSIEIQEETTLKSTKNIFKLKYNGVDILSLFYTPTNEGYYDVWSNSDEDNDFFAWLITEFTDINKVRKRIDERIHINFEINKES